MSTRAIIIFPYRATLDGETCRILAETLGRVTEPGNRINTSNAKPILVVPYFAIEKGSFGQLDAEMLGRTKELTSVLKIWSVDTCQAWLDGIGKALNDSKANPEIDNTTSIIQIPGDLKDVADLKSGAFWTNLANLSFKVTQGNLDFCIGDFETESYTAKDLIDVYGTYPLLYNWFPEVAKWIQENQIALKMPRLKRPRSEFFAARLTFIGEMIMKRWFAYEQTVAFLIHAYKDITAVEPEKRRNWRLGSVSIGKVEDYSQQRGFSEALNQIERTERMLKLLWREYNEKDYFPVAAFNELDRKSQAIRNAAIVSLENYLCNKD